MDRILLRLQESVKQMGNKFYLLIREYDTTGTQNLNFDDFQRLLLRIDKTLNETESRQIFNSLDEDSNGSISANELLNVHLLFMHKLQIVQTTASLRRKSSWNPKQLNYTKTSQSVLASIQQYMETHFTSFDQVQNQLLHS